MRSGEKGISIEETAWRSHNVTETDSIFGEREQCDRVTRWVDRKKEVRLEYSWTRLGSTVNAVGLY